MVLLHKNNFSQFKFEKYILVITILKSTPTETEWINTKKIIISYYDSAVIGNFKFSIIFDLRQLGILPIIYYQEWANLFIEKKELTKKHINRTCIITDNNWIKTSLNLFFKIYTTIRPFQFVSDLDKAFEFINIQD